MEDLLGDEDTNDMEESPPPWLSEQICQRVPVPSQYTMVKKIGHGAHNTAERNERNER